MAGKKKKKKKGMHVLTENNASESRKENTTKNEFWFKFQISWNTSQDKNTNRI